MNDQAIVHDLFSAMLGLDTVAEIEPVMEEVMDENPF
jgi:hypothetical protein